MYGYGNGSIEPVVVDEGGYISILRGFINKIKSIPKKIDKHFSKENNANSYPTIINSSQMTEIYINDMDNYVYNTLVENLLRTMDLLEIELRNDFCFDEEINDFIEIKYITEYILKRNYNDLIKEDIDLMSSLTDLFFDLTYTKKHLISKELESLDKWDTESREKYLKEYEHFEDKFMDYKDVFYEKIYVHKTKHDETAIALSNLLKE